MSPRRAAKSPKSEGSAGAGSTGHLLRSATWAGLRKGDPVEVRDVKMRSASWEFVAHIRNTESGAEWVEVVGGRHGDRTLRSFRPEQVFPPASKGGRRSPKQAPASLAEAPQLPFGS